MNTDSLLAAAEAAYRAGDRVETRRVCDEVLRADPLAYRGWLLLGQLNRDEGRRFEAEAAWRRALALDGGRFEAHVYLAQTFRALGRLPEAAAAYQTALSLNAHYAPAWLGWCELLIQQGQYEEAITVGEAAQSVGVAEPDVLLNLGNAYFHSERFEQAEGYYRHLLSDTGTGLSAHYNLVLVLDRMGRRGDALAVLRALLGLKPDHLNAWIKLADMLADMGDPAGAAEAYRSALTLRPDMGELHNNLGKSLRLIGRVDESVACFKTAIDLGVRQPVVYLNLGGAYQIQRRLEDALAAYRQGLALDPDNFTLLTSAVHVQQMLCDWDGMERLHERLVPPALTVAQGVLPPPCFPFLALPVAVSGQEHRRIADNYARYLGASVGTPYRHRREGRDGRPLRIGYVSADFHNHATAHLMLGLFRRHDRRRVEVWAYSLGSDDGSHYRRRIAADCDRFVDVSTLSDGDAAARMHGDGIDILVDLKGYTGGARPAIFARRPAPVQVQYLGYPGTMGGDFIDYVVADRVVLPEAELADYAEAPVWMPHCYQVNDNEQAIAEPAPSRAECGLPETGFVFCCFNSPYKIEPTIFGVWMDLLRDLPGSVLWLYAGNAAAVSNRRQEAAKRGIDPARLVFADSVAKDKHLARHRHADLFLDTLYYNAHTTGSDALWAGVPMISLPGRSFASRVGESLLRAVGLGDLVVPDLSAYAGLALALAWDPARLAAVRERLAANRLTAPLFDTDAFARGLEDAYGQMWARWQSDRAPAPIAVLEPGVKS